MGWGVVWCGVVWCGVVWCGVVWCGVVWCGVVWCGVVWCEVVIWCVRCSLVCNVRGMAVLWGKLDGVWRGGLGGAPSTASMQVRTAMSYLLLGDLTPCTRHLQELLAITPAPCPGPGLALLSHGETLAAVAPASGPAPHLGPMHTIVRSVAAVAVMYTLTGTVETGGRWQQHRPASPVRLTFAQLQRHGSPERTALYAAAAAHYIAGAVANWDLDALLWCIPRLESPSLEMQAAAAHILKAVLRSTSPAAWRQLEVQLVQIAAAACSDGNKMVHGARDGDKPPQPVPGGPDKFPPPTRTRDPVAVSAVLLLALMCTHACHTLAPGTAPLVAERLLGFARSGTVMRICALRFLGEHFEVWRPGLDIVDTLRLLLNLAVTRRSTPNDVVVAATTAFTIAAEADVRALIEVLQKVVGNVRTQSQAICVLTLLMAVVDRCPDRMYFYLLELVRLLMQFTALACLRASTDVVWNIIFPLQVQRSVGVGSGRLGGGGGGGGGRGVCWGGGCVKGVGRRSPVISLCI